MAEVGVIHEIGDYSSLRKGSDKDQELIKEQLEQEKENNAQVVTENK